MVVQGKQAAGRRSSPYSGRVCLLGVCDCKEGRPEGDEQAQITQSQGLWLEMWLSGSIVSRGGT